MANFGYRDIPNSSWDQNGSHFPKWRSVYTFCFLLHPIPCLLGMKDIAMCININYNAHAVQLLHILAEKCIFSAHEGQKLSEIHDLAGRMLTYFTITMCLFLDIN